MFRRDSGVYWPYDSIDNIWGSLRRKGSGNPKQDIDEILFKKTNLAVWIVSNCDSTRGAVKRMKLVNELIDAGLKVDCFGRCFSTNGLPKNTELIYKYKFYLAFENGYHCVDYITEKLTNNAFRNNAVPVVWGAKKLDYLAIVPRHSCIFAEDFKTPKDLVKYLNYLDKNHTAYKEYFMWRIKNVTELPQYRRTIRICHLCRMLHGINVDNIFHPDYETLKTYIPTFGYPTKPRIVKSLGKWFYGTENLECFDNSSHLASIGRNTTAYLKSIL